MTLLPEDALQLILAVLIGGLIGAEREYRDKAAGFRTIMLICVGATIFSNFSLRLGGAVEPTRIAASVVSGVGFLGAGAILRGSGHVTGLTTASTIWLAAALGMGIGGGQYAVVLAATAAVLIVLSVFPRIEIWIDNLTHARTYEVVCPANDEALKEIESLFRENGLHVMRTGHAKSGDRLTCEWEVQGKPEEHDQLIGKLLAHADVQEFRT
jgi:putative Mg2+ transporter-C (MgtC) family protein